MKIINPFQTNGFTLSLALKRRLEGTWKWTVEVVYDTIIYSANNEENSEQFNIVLFQCCSLSHI